jgi:co-chaperonin GroES (HSP10)
MKLEPYGERIIVKRKITEKVGLIHVPDSKQKISLQGEVVEVGPDATWVKPGDRVLFWKNSGFELPNELDGYKDCLLMNNDDLLACIKD